MIQIGALNFIPDVDRGLMCKLSLDFSDDSSYQIPMLSGFQGDKVRALSFHVDNSQNGSYINWRSGNDEGKIPPNVQGTFSTKGFDEIIFECTNPIIIDCILYTNTKQYGFVSAGIVTASNNTILQVGEAVRAADFISIEGSGLGYWSDSASNPIGVARPLNNNAVAYNQAGGEYNFDLTPYSGFSKIDGKYTQSICVDGKLLTFFIAGYLGFYHLFCVTYDEDLKQDRLIDFGLATLFDLKVVNTQSGNIIFLTWAYYSGGQTFTTVVFLTASIDTQSVGFSKTFTGQMTGLHIDKISNNTVAIYYALEGDIYIRVYDVSGNQIHGALLSNGTNATIGKRNIDFVTNANDDYICLYQRFNGTQFEVFYMVLSSAMSIVVPETSLGFVVVSGAVSTILKAEELPNGNILFLVSNVTNCTVFLRNYQGGALNSDILTASTVNMADVVDCGGGEFCTLHCDGSAPIEVEVRKYDVSGAVTGNLILETTINCSTSDVSLLHLSDDNLLAMYKQNGTVDFKFAYINTSTMTLIGSKKTISSDAAASRCDVVELLHTWHYAGYPSIMTMVSKTTSQQQFFALHVPVRTPYGVSLSDGDTEIPLKIVGTINSRVLFTPSVSVNAQAQTPPGQKFNIVGNLVTLYGIYS